MNLLFKKEKNKNAFTLGDMMMAMIVVGVLAMMTIPVIANKSHDKERIESFTKFNVSLENAMNKWKQDILCNNDAYMCLEQQDLKPNNCENFEQIEKYLDIGEKTGLGEAPDSISWLPKTNYEYNGDEQIGVYGGISKKSTGTCRYVLLNGATFSVKVNKTGFDLQIDTNGIKPPNRMGKDIFPISIGNVGGKDIYYYPSSSQVDTNTLGLCSLPDSNCDPNNYDPKVSNGASITTYMILNKKLPDFHELSKKYSDFKP